MLSISNFDNGGLHNRLFYDKVPLSQSKIIQWSTIICLIWNDVTFEIAFERAMVNKHVMDMELLDM